MIRTDDSENSSILNDGGNKTPPFNRFAALKKKGINNTKDIEIGEPSDKILLTENIAPIEKNKKKKKKNKEKAKEKEYILEKEGS
jgi:hypothetical protein